MARLRAAKNAGNEMAPGVRSAAMKLLLAVSAGIVIGMVALGCDAMKAREPKQASDPVAQPTKYGDTKLDTMGGGDGGTN
jgi:hypothetical protein